MKQLKAELATLDRKILLSLKSVDAQEANTEGVTEIRPEPQAPSVAQPAPSMPGDPAVPAASEPYVHRMPDYMAHAAERKPPVLSAMPKTISIKELMSAGKEKVVIGGIPPTGRRHGEAAGKTEMEDEAVSGVHLMKNLATTYSKVVAKFSISNLANTFFICFSPKCILSLELRINLLCRLPFFLAFRFQVSYLLRKAFSSLPVTTGVSLIGRAINPCML